MPVPSVPLEKLGFLTIGLFDEADPRPGHETTLRSSSSANGSASTARGCATGTCSTASPRRSPCWPPRRSAPAASSSAPRSSRSAGRTRCGWPRTWRPSTCSPAAASTPGSASARRCTGTTSRTPSTRTPRTPRTSATSGCARLLRLVARRAGQHVRGTEGVVEEFSDRVQPHSPGLRDRLWYGGASLRSARWAGEHGMNFLTSSVVKAEEAADFAEIQRSHIRDLPARHPAGAPPASPRASWSSRPTARRPAQRAKYAAYVERAHAADRRARRARPGCCSRPTWSAPPSRSPRRCTRTPASGRSPRWRSRCRSASTHADYAQILTDIATRLGPALGWQPRRSD